MRFKVESVFVLLIGCASSRNNVYNFLKKIVRFVTRTFPRNFRSEDPTTMVGIVSGELRRVFSLNADFSRHYSRADTVYASSVP